MSVINLCLLSFRWFWKEKNCSFLVSLNQLPKFKVHSHVKSVFAFLPPANEVWGKEIFSETCVSHSAHRGVSV